jgi:hypothetical protein
VSTIAIKVHPYVKQVMLHEFGEEPILAAQNNMIGIMTRPLLKDRSEKKRLIKGDLSENLQIMLPKRLRHIKRTIKYSSVPAGLMISDEDSVKLSFAFKKFADLLLVKSILILISSGLHTMKAFDKVYELYDLNEDILDRENLMALYKRHKQERLKQYHKRIKDKKGTC